MTIRQELALACPVAPGETAVAFKFVGALWLREDMFLGSVLVVRKFVAPAWEVTMTFRKNQATAIVLAEWGREAVALARAYAEELLRGVGVPADDDRWEPAGEPRCGMTLTRALNATDLVAYRQAVGS